MAEPNDANSVYDFLNVSETLLIDVGKNMNNLTEVSRQYSFLNESEQSMLESLNAALASVTKKLERVKGAASDINREEAEKHGLEHNGAELIFKLRLFNRIKHKIYRSINVFDKIVETLHGLGNPNRDNATFLAVTLKVFKDWWRGHKKLIGEGFSIASTIAGSIPMAGFLSEIFALAGEYIANDKTLFRSPRSGSNPG